MADITMCRDESCPDKDNCYRQTAVVNEYGQSFFALSPMNKDTLECEYYWANSKQE